MTRTTTDLYVDFPLNRQTLPTFAEIAARKIELAGPRDKTINMKICINTARMMVEAEMAVANMIDSEYAALAKAEGRQP